MSTLNQITSTFLERAWNNNIISNHRITMNKRWVKLEDLNSPQFVIEFDYLDTWSIPHCGTCLCSNCLDQIPRTCRVFTWLFTSNTPWYFLDFALFLIVVCLKFDLVVSHSGMKDKGSKRKFCNVLFQNLKLDPQSVFHNTTRNVKVELILIKIFPF